MMVAVISLAAMPSSVAAQARPRAGAVPPGPQTEDGVSQAEIQRLFDAYVVMQAQQELQLSDEQSMIQAMALM